MRLALKEGWEYGQVLDEELVRFASGTDLYIGEAQYTDEEYRGRVGWGHSSLSATVGVALKAGVKSLALFHHDPMHSDETVSEAPEGQAPDRWPALLHGVLRRRRGAGRRGLDRRGPQRPPPIPPPGEVAAAKPPLGADHHTRGATASCCAPSTHDRAFPLQRARGQSKST
jgi:hypothetical protein